MRATPEATRRRLKLRRDGVGARSATQRLAAGETGDTQADQVEAEAKKGLAVGGTVGAALEVVPPPFGQLLHAAAAFFGAIGGAIAGAFRDTFHPNALQATAWLVIFQIAPGMLFSGVDTITTKSGNRDHPAEDLAARLVRYFLLISGIVKNVQGDLYNPTDTRCDNPVMCTVDRKYPLTDPKETARIKALVERHIGAPPEVHSRTEARAAMAILRKVLAPSGLMDWSQMKANPVYLRHAVRTVRYMAGESGPDAALAALLGGDVTPLAPRLHTRRIRAVPLTLKSKLGRPGPVTKARAPRPAPATPLDPFRGLGRKTPGEAGDFQAPNSALTTLLDQIDQRWPRRERGQLDGLLSFVPKAFGELKLALRVTDGISSASPELDALAAAVRNDPRTESVEVVSPGFFNALDRSYLQIVVRNARRRDTSPWKLDSVGVVGEASGTASPYPGWKTQRVAAVTGVRDPFAELA